MNTDQLLDEYIQAMLQPMIDDGYVPDDSPEEIERWREAFKPTLGYALFALRSEFVPLRDAFVDLMQRLVKIIR